MKGEQSFICCSASLTSLPEPCPSTATPVCGKTIFLKTGPQCQKPGTTALDPQVNRVTAGQGLWYSFDRRNRGLKKLNSLPKVTEQASSGSGARIEVFTLPAPRPLYSVTLPPLDSATHDGVLSPLSQCSPHIINDFIFYTVSNLFTVIHHYPISDILFCGLNHSNSNLSPAFCSPPMQTVARVSHGLALQHQHPENF